jgi:SAM-dependent methyltransferase
MTEDRKAAEAAFHDRLREVLDDQVWSPEAEDRFRSDPLWANMKYYAVERRNRDFVSEWLGTHCKGRDVLDYCCGNGVDSIRIAQMGARSVVGIDISEVSVSNCRARAGREGVADRVRFEVMDAEQLRFPDNSFDVVHIYGVLHHLDLRKAYSEIARVLRPGGCAIATEAMKHNPLIDLYRRKTPQLRTEWEVDHILGREEIALGRQYFRDVRPHLFNLATLAAVPLRRTPLFRPVLSTLEIVDALLLRLPGLKWWAWMCVFTLGEPVGKGS